MKTRLAYTVFGSEDGVLGITTSARKAAKMALHYVTQSAANPYNEKQIVDLAREVRRAGNAETDTATLRGLASCSGCISAEITEYTMNYSAGKFY